MSNTQTDEMVWIFNTVSGEIYQLYRYELKAAQLYEVPLKKRPNSNCKKCYGRLYTGRIPETGYFYPCAKCMRAFADIEYINEHKI